MFVTRSLPADLQPVDAFQRLHDWPHMAWFDSAGGPPALARYTIMTADPLQLVTANEAVDGALDRLRPYIDRLAALPAPPPALPFTGGLAGILSYDLCRSLEAIPDHRIVDLTTPAMFLGWYDWALIWDHQLRCGYAVAHGWQNDRTDFDERSANQRLDQVFAQLAGPICTPKPNVTRGTSHLNTLAPQYSTQFDHVLSNFRSHDFREAVQAVVGYIRAGDVFQVNLAQRLLIEDALPPAERYLRLRQANRAPFGGYFDGGSWHLLSSSPERLLKIFNGEVETRPIKGTCPRTGSRDADQLLSDQLLSSVKDRAENIMIVDLMRNDLSRFCEDSSVRVEQLCGLEQFARVQHLVSVVKGRMQPSATALDALRAVFPGGSITGAPKPRAMEIIAELEPTRRGPYCGSFGYVTCGGRADFNILIRTLTSTEGWMQIPVGGGITARSQPQLEEQETWDKAAAMLAAFSA